MKIIPLSEGVFTIDKSKIFLPFDLDKDELQARKSGSLLVEVQPFIIITKTDILLLDTGLGFMQQSKMQLHKNLAANNINPDDVTKVLLSHLHKDHAGGVGYKDKLGYYNLAFANATYYVQQPEFDYAMNVGFPSYMAEEISILENNRQVIFLNEQAGFIDDYIQYKITGAHSPHHQVFWVKENNETIFLVQMMHRNYNK